MKRVEPRTEAETLERCFDTFQGALVSMRFTDTLGYLWNINCSIPLKIYRRQRTHEYILTLQSTFADGSTDMCLTFVRLCRVNETAMTWILEISVRPCSTKKK